MKEHASCDRIREASVGEEAFGGGGGDVGGGQVEVDDLRVGGEVERDDDGAAVCGGGADVARGHWG